MDTDPNNTTNDPSAGPPAPEGSPGGHKAPRGLHGASVSPDDYKQQARGRAAMDCWMLHKTFMDDLAQEEAAPDPSDDLPPPAPAV